MNTPRWTTLLAAAAMAAALAAPWAGATTREDTTAGLVLRGEGVLRYALFVDVYRARLYATPEVGPDRLLDPAVPKRLELTYLTEIERDLFVEAATTVLERQHPPETLARLRPGLDALHAAYRDVGPGDVYTLVHVPGVGAWLELNDQELHRFDDERLAQAYFGIWLGEDPISPKLKRKLLRG